MRPQPQPPFFLRSERELYAAKISSQAYDDIVQVLADAIVESRRHPGFRFLVAGADGSRIGAYVGGRRQCRFCYVDAPLRLARCEHCGKALS